MNIMDVMGGEDGEDERSFDCCGKILYIKHDLGQSFENLEYGTTIWPSSEVIAKYFELEVLPQQSLQHLKGKQILEIGAGVGLAGIALASMGARVMLTDYKKNLLTLLRENISSNNLVQSAEASLIDWSDKKHHIVDQKDHQEYDYIILADVLYYDTGAAEGLVPTLLAKASAKTEILLAYEDRQNEASLAFFDRAQEHFEAEQLAIPAAVRSAVGRQKCKPVRLYRMVLRPQATHQCDNSNGP
jgi:predicted nicotinamide N-methyase